jgi:hypothetical protein
LFCGDFIFISKNKNKINVECVEKFCSNNFAYLFIIVN